MPAEEADLDEAVAAQVRRELEVYGVRMTAEKQAQAKRIRRREETTSTRSLLNRRRPDGLPE